MHVANGEGSALQCIHIMECMVPGAYEGKERIGHTLLYVHVDTVVIILFLSNFGRFLCRPANV